MKVAILSLLTLVLCAVIKPDQFSYSSPAILGEVPGESPIETCRDDEEQLLDIELVDLDPNPPIPGENLTITAKGTLKQELIDGAYVDVVVRYGFITLVNRRYDLCELLPEVDLECPLKAGYLSLTRTVEIPEEAPPGSYSIEAQAYTVADELVTCLQADVTLE